MTLSDYLKDLREKERLSRSNWADKCGVSRMTVWRWGSERTIPREYELQAVLKAVEVPPQERMRAHTLRNEAQFRTLRETMPATADNFVHRGDLLRALRGRRGWTQ